jgi:hypothetical protein
MVRQISKKHIVLALVLHGCVIFVGHNDTKKAKRVWLSLLVEGEIAQIVVSFVLQFYI